MLCSVASDLVQHCLLMSHKKDARLLWVKCKPGITTDFLILFQVTFFLVNSLEPSTNDPGSRFIAKICVQQRLFN